MRETLDPKLTEKIELVHIVAMAKERIIGRDGGLPWHIPEDMRFFRDLTMGHAVIMGRTTFASLKRPLPGRINIVVSRSSGHPTGTLPEPLPRPGEPAVREKPPVVFAPSLNAALGIAGRVVSAWGREVFVIGGTTIYEQTMDAAVRLYVTEVDLKIAGDRRYPEVDPTRFREIERRSEKSSTGIGVTWVIYEAM